MPKPFRSNNEMEEKNPDKFYYLAMIALVLSGVATALMSKEGIKTTLKNLIAALCAGGVTIIVLDSLHFSTGVILLCSNLMTAFASKFWPLVGNIFEKWAKTKLYQILGITESIDKEKEGED